MVADTIKDLIEYGVPNNRLAILHSLPKNGGYGMPKTFRDADQRDHAFAIGETASRCYVYVIETGIAHVIGEYSSESQACSAFETLVLSYIGPDGRARLPSKEDRGN